MANGEWANERMSEWVNLLNLLTDFHLAILKM